jgi:hypothetical protein
MQSPAQVGTLREASATFGAALMGWDSTLKVVADYQIHPSLTRRRWGGDPEAITEAQKTRQRAVTTGKLRMEGDLSAAPPAIEKLVHDLHGPTAALTA